MTRGLRLASWCWRCVDARLVAKAERVVQTFLLPYVDDSRRIKATTRLILENFGGLATHRILAHSEAIAKGTLPEE